jgi:hypothetical protein
MYEPSIANIEYLKREISKSGLTFSHLKDDMIDHVCCDVEFEMQSGLPFEKAYELVKEKIGIDGLMRIQEDTMFLIYKNYRIMKKLMKISGLIAPILIAFGSLFKIQHWVGAGIMLVLGFFCLTFLFLPSAMYVSYREVSNKTKLANHITGFIGFFLIAISFLFKVMHWLGAGMIIFAGIVIICFIFLPIVLITKIREKTIQLPPYVLFVATVGMILYLLGFFFKTMHWPGASILLFVGAILLVVVALPVYVYKTYKNEGKIENSFIYLIVALVWLFTPTMLITLNVSNNVLHPLYNNTFAIEANVEVAKAQKELILHKFQNDKNASEIDKSATNLLNFIQSSKASLIKVSEATYNSNSVGPDNQINLYSIRYFETNVYNKVMFNTDKKNEKLHGLIRSYQEVINKVVSDKANRQFTINSLEFNFGTDIGDHELILTSLNRLSMLQVSVLEVETMALLNLSTTASDKVNNSLSKKL